MEINGKKIVIIGLGRSGMALARMILHFSGLVKISDQSSYGVVHNKIQEAKLSQRVVFEAGQHTKEFILDSDFVVISPGVRLDSLPVKWALDQGLPVLGEMEFAWKFCRNVVIAVTGSNGKTTVSTLIAEILRSAGKGVCLCGNIGSPLADHIATLELEDIVVLEASSFQLESCKEFRPDVSVFLNCSQNHLDRHEDMDEYFLAKTNIFSRQTKKDYAVMTSQDQRLVQMSKTITAHVCYFDEPEDILRFPHDNLNYLAARKVSQILGISDNVISNVFEDFRGVEHRLEWVRAIDNVDFINDSKSTTVESGRWAIHSMKKPIIMISGGSSKNLDYSSLRSIINKKVKRLIVIGEIQDLLFKTFKDVTIVSKAETLSQAVIFAKQSAQEGDCVLFCPMTASFDMFNNFEHRGKEYKRMVQELNV